MKMRERLQESQESVNFYHDGLYSLRRIIQYNVVEVDVMSRLIFRLESIIHILLLIEI